MQSVPTGFSAEKLIAPLGILSSFCSNSSFALKIVLCLSHVTPTMYSSLSDTIDIMNSGGLTHGLPFSLIEQRSGSNVISLQNNYVNVHEFTGCLLAR
jgi:hypothetical protein